MGAKRKIIGIGAAMVALYSIFSGLFSSRATAAASGVSSGVVGAGGTAAAPTPSRKPAILSYPQDRALSELEVSNIASEINAYFGYEFNINDLVASAYVESRYRPYVERYESKLNDSSVGLMQTLTGTALDLYNKGYRAFGYPSRQALHNPAVSMYFGAAYFDWLRKTYPNKSIEWYVRAYNGGAGGATKSYTAAYWAKWRAKRNMLSGVSIYMGV